MSLVCEYCGGKFEQPHSKGTVPKYCSGAHRQRAHEDRKRGRLEEQVRTLTAENHRLKAELRRRP